MEYNGAAVLAMTGKNCVCIGSDTRLGIQGQTVATDFQKVFPVHDKLYLGLAGLASDVQSLSSLVNFRHALYKLQEEREIAPRTFSTMLSNMLYEKRFGPWFAEPVVAGLGSDGTPFISAMDLIGCEVFTPDFVVAGTCSENLYGMCESLYRPDMSPDELFEVAAQALVSAADRDAMSGWGAVVHVITKEGVTTRKVMTRMD